MKWIYPRLKKTLSTFSIENRVTNIKTLIKQAAADHKVLTEVLRKLVDTFAYIDLALVPYLADQLNLSRAEVLGVISFYEDFRTEKPPTHVIRICQAEACQAVGARQLLKHSHSEKFSDLADIEIGTVSCLGLCACGPALIHNDELHGKVGTAQFDSLIQAITPQK